MPQTSSSLLSTKLNRPPVTGDRVDRPRLIEMLDRGLSKPVSLVSAAAGFGKTTLVSAWIERQGRQTTSAWLSLDENDSDLVVFLRYFVAAIRTAFPDSCAETLALLGAPVPTSEAPLLVALTNEIEQLPSRLVLVVDDYHLIQGAAVHDFLNGLLRHWPQQLHLVLISRTSPPLPVATLRAKGQIVEIRTRDLRFTAEESAAFLERTLAEPLSPSALDFLDQRLEGWIAGLRLVTLSLSNAAGGEAELTGLAGTNVEIAEYLVDEVVSFQTPVMLKFLLTTSILERFCAGLCEQVLTNAGFIAGLKCDARVCIEWLERHNLFIVPLDSNKEWHRYHHLFQELLQRRLLAEVGPEQVRELHRAAAAWFAGQGLIDEALHHALAALDLGLAARLMVGGFRDALDREDRATLDRWLRLLPEEFIERQPWLLLIKALAFAFSWRLTAVSKLIGQIEALQDEGYGYEIGSGEEAIRSADAAGRLPVENDRQTLRGLIALLRGQEAFTNSQVGLAIAYCEKALALLPGEWRYARGGAILYWGLSMGASGHGPAAQRRLLDEYESLLHKSDAYALRLLFAVCFNAFEAGDLAQAKRMAQVMLEQSMASRLVILQGFARYFLGAVHYHWNELDAARWHFEEGVDKRYSIHVQAARNCLIGLAQVHRARGDISEAWEAMELLTELDLERTGHEGDDASSFAAELAYLRGDADAAHCWAEAYVVAVPDRLVNWLQDPHLARANILVTRGSDLDLQQALEILDALLETARRSFSVRFQIEILALRAVALEKQERSAAALGALEQAVELARRGAFIRVFVDLGPTMQTLLLRLAARGFAHNAVRRILSAFPEADGTSEPGAEGSPVRVSNAALIEPLTDRELDVLALLRERLSNKEIAHMLGLSVMTVKRHTSNIYGKLGVGRRRDAVIKAETLKILPPR